MDEVNGVEVILDVDGERFVDGSEGRYSREVLATLNLRVHVHNTEPPIPEPREDLFLQILVQSLRAHRPR